MKTIKIERIEGIYAICEDCNHKFYAIETSELPESASKGDILTVDDEMGTLTVKKKSKAR